MEHNGHVPPSYEPAYSQDPPRANRETTLLDVAIVLLKHKKLLVGVPAAFATVAAVVSFLLPVYYTGRARILPPQQGQSSASLMLGSLAGAMTGGAGGGSAAGFQLKNPADLYVAMLRSRSVADALIERFGLKQVYGEEKLTHAREELSRVVQVTAGREGIVTIEVDDKDPKRAAALANGFVDELLKLNQSLAITEASQRRLFFERQLISAKRDLAVAETELRKTQEATGIIRLDDQGKSIIESVARLQAQVAAKEVQIGAMRTFATAQNAEYTVVHNELIGLRAQLARAERDQKMGGGNILVPTGRIPEAGLEYIRKLRDVKYFETIFELLARQFEVAKIDEAKDMSFIQVLDQAIEPELKSRPKRALIVMLALVFGFLLAGIWAFVREVGNRVSDDNAMSDRLDELRQHLGWR